jgi:hypothetical protein
MILALPPIKQIVVVQAVIMVYGIPGKQKGY